MRPNATRSSVLGQPPRPECHRHLCHLWCHEVTPKRRAGFGFHLTASTVSATTRRLVVPRFGERFAFRLGAKFVENLSQSPNAGREWAPVVLNDFVKLADQRGGFFVGKFKVHIPRYQIAIRESPNSDATNFGHPRGGSNVLSPPTSTPDSRGFLNLIIKAFHQVARI